MENEIKLTALGREYVEIADRIKELEERRKEIKDEISNILKEEGTAFIMIPVGDDLLFKFKNNYRATKSFDKAGLAKQIGWDKENLDYVGISQAVEKEYANSTTIGQFQTKNESTFVTVRMTKVKVGKKGK